MKNTENKAIGRNVRLDKGYKTKLNQLIKKKGFGGISEISNATGLGRDTVSRIAKEGKCFRSSKAKVQEYLDNKITATEPTNK